MIHYHRQIVSIEQNVSILFYFLPTNRLIILRELWNYKQKFFSVCHKNSQKHNQHSKLLFFTINLHSRISFIYLKRSNPQTFKTFSLVSMLLVELTSINVLLFYVITRRRYYLKLYSYFKVLLTVMLLLSLKPVLWKSLHFMLFLQ